MKYFLVVHERLHLPYVYDEAFQDLHVAVETAQIIAKIARTSQRILQSPSHIDIYQLTFNNVEHIRRIAAPIRKRPSAVRPKDIEHSHAYPRTTQVHPDHLEELATEVFYEVDDTLADTLMEAAQMLRTAIKAHQVEVVLPHPDPLWIPQTELLQTPG